MSEKLLGVFNGGFFLPIMIETAYVTGKMRQQKRSSLTSNVRITLVYNILLLIRLDGESTIFFD